MIWEPKSDVSISFTRVYLTAAFTASVNDLFRSWSEREDGECYSWRVLDVAFRLFYCPTGNSVFITSPWSIYELGKNPSIKSGPAESSGLLGARIPEAAQRFLSWLSTLEQTGSLFNSSEIITTFAGRPFEIMTAGTCSQATRLWR